MVESDLRPSDVLLTEVVRGRKSVRPKTAGQKRYVDAVRDHTVTFAIGPAGTGKSYLAVALAVQALQAKAVNRIILTRPAVEAGERLGFLPGDMLAKVDPYLRPLYDALYDMLDPETVARLMDRGVIEVAPLAYMRGRTLNDSFIILDEAQNTTAEQMKMFLTRLGFGSKIVVTGDVTQIDLPDGRGRSGSAGGALHPRGRRRPGVRGPRFRRRRAPPHRAGHRRRLRGERRRSSRERRDERRLDLRQRRAARRPGRRDALGVPRPPRGGRGAGARVPPSCRCSSWTGRRSRSSTRSSSAGPVPPTCSPSRWTTTSCCPAASPTRAGGVPARRARGASRRRSSATSSSVPAVAQAQAPEHGATLDDELALLVVHGVLHLLNYDHADPREAGDDAAARARAPRTLP